jgi:predicted nucleic acid-binding protein
MKIYLDACAVNRLTDDQGQPRIREEAEAIEFILRRMRDGAIEWISSEALVDEINRNPQLERRLENSVLLKLANETIELDQDIVRRAKELEAAGYGVFDALHLASAESAEADVLLTTDDGFTRKASRGDGRPRIPVSNPVSWIKGHRRDQPRHIDG